MYRSQQTAEQIVEDQLAKINKNARIQRKKIRNLSDAFEYSHYSYGEARVAGYFETFEDYLEASAKLPADNELDSYDLHWRSEMDDSLAIKHKVQFGKDPYHDAIRYCFIVGQPVRTLELLTEGKCKMVRKVTEPFKPEEYNVLQCEDK